MAEFVLGKKLTEQEEWLAHIVRGIERERIIELLTDLNAIRRDALGHLVAFNTDGTQVIYLEGLEK